MRTHGIYLVAGFEGPELLEAAEPEDRSPVTNTTNPGILPRSLEASERYAMSYQLATERYKEAFTTEPFNEEDRINAQNRVLSRSMRVIAYLAPDRCIIAAAAFRYRDEDTAYVSDVFSLRPASDQYTKHLGSRVLACTMERILADLSESPEPSIAIEVLPTNREGLAFFKLLGFALEPSEENFSVDGLISLTLTGRASITSAIDMLHARAQG